MPKRKYIKKVCLLGDGGVGKTSLVRRYVLDLFDDKYIETFGAKVSKKVLDMEEVELTMMIWDILGQKTQKHLHSTYYAGASGALLVFDLTRPETLESTLMWAQDLKEVSMDAPMMIVGNKYDLESKVSQEMLEGIAAKLDCDLLLTSAKTGEGVEETFQNLGRMMMGV